MTRVRFWGGYRDSSGDHGFVDTNGSYRPINVPGAVNTDVGAINNAGDIVGYYQDSANGPEYGFLYSHGTYTTISPPGSYDTIPQAINSSGEIVGFFTTSISPSPEYGFIYDHGTYTILNEPGAVSTAAWSINDKGQVVGLSGGPSPPAGTFIYSGGEFTAIPPGNGQPNDINNKGQIVGTYTGADGNTHGFLTQDPVQAVANDTFVFVPNLGEQTSTQINVHNDMIDPPQSQFTQLAELLSHAHQDPASLPHDATDGMHDAATLAAQHAHHFLL